MHPSRPARAPSTVARLAGPLLSLVLAACTQGGGRTDAGVSLETNVRCATAAECSFNDGAIVFTCDASRRECVCTSDAACANHPAGPYCNAFTGRCVADVAGCKGDGECGTGDYCDQAQRTCKPRRSYCEPCSSDAECGAGGERCVRLPGSIATTTYCLGPCGDGDTCASGRTCRDTEEGRLCAPSAGGCRGAVGACIPDEGTPCTRTEDCNGSQSQVCDRTLGRCILDPEAASCPADQSCDATTRTCELKCRQDAECVTRKGEQGWVCINSACVPASTCQVDSDCPSSNLFCFKSPSQPANVPGTCAQTCNAPEDCPLGQSCVNDDATARRRCVTGCRGNQDCPMTAVCEGGTCQFGTPTAPRCQVRQACPFGSSCIAGTCQKQVQHCASATNGCPGGRATVMTHSAGCGATSRSCQPVLTSTDPDDKAAFGCGTTNVRYCEMTRCLVSCTNDGQCPNGFSCANYGPTVGTLCTPMAWYLASKAPGEPCVNFP